MLSVCNSYFPQGENRKHPDKFPYKERYYKRITDHIGNLDSHVVLTGDFNIAPFENDVWSHKSLLNVVSHTKSETNYFSKLLKYGVFEDIVRNHFKRDDKIYSWWSYRNKDWKKSNRGRRLDHILISKNIKKYIQSVKIYRSSREEIKPSDHVPISITLVI